MLRQSLNLNDSLTERSIARAVDTMKSGNLYRYTTSRRLSEVTELEMKLRQFLGAKHAVCVNSCGSALFIALKALGINPGDEVLLSVFTYTAVPSAVHHIGAKVVLVECTADYTLDLEDLKRKISSKTKALVVSHMRGHISDMSEVRRICQEGGVLLIEDCAHSLGGTFDGISSGLFGHAACFSFQSHKLLNCGEGGALVTNIDDVCHRAVLYAGSQEEAWRTHGLESEDISLIQNRIPNYSLRLSNLAAGVLLPQLDSISELEKIYDRNYQRLHAILAQCPDARLPSESPKVKRIRDTMQFSFPDMTVGAIDTKLDNLKRVGITMKRFGVLGNPRYYKTWQYLPEIENVTLAQTDFVLQHSCDLRIPSWLSESEVDFLGASITKEFGAGTRKSS